VSALSEATILALEQGRAIAGEDVVMNGATYRVRTVEVSGAKAGEQALPHTTYGIYVASAAPRLFDFSPRSFVPYTAVPPPTEGTEVTRNNLVYVFASVDYENIDNDTVAIYCYGLRKIWTVPVPAP
jgi:hypothetical protein